MLRLGFYGPGCQKFINCNTIVEAREAYVQYARQPQTEIVKDSYTYKGLRRGARRTSHFVGYDLLDSQNTVIASGNIEWDA